MTKCEICPENYHTCDQVNSTMVGKTCNKGYFHHTKNVSEVITSSCEKCNEMASECNSLTTM